MKIKHIVEQFQTVDFSEWEMVKNRNTQALWLRMSNSCLKAHIRRDSDDMFIVRLYRFVDIGDFSGINYRITITPEALELCTLVIGKDIPDESIHIMNFQELSTEDNFFQQSLVQDVGDLDCTDIQTLIHLNSVIIELSKGVI